MKQLALVLTSIVLFNLISCKTFYTRENNTKENYGFFIKDGEFHYFFPAKINLDKTLIQDFVQSEKRTGYSLYRQNWNLEKYDSIMYKMDTINMVLFPNLKSGGTSIDYEVCRVNIKNLISPDSFNEKQDSLILKIGEDTLNMPYYIYHRNVFSIDVIEEEKDSKD